MKSGRASAWRPGVAGCSAPALERRRVCLGLVHAAGSRGRRAGGQIRPTVLIGRFHFVASFIWLFARPSKRVRGRIVFELGARHPPPARSAQGAEQVDADGDEVALLDDQIALHVTQFLQRVDHRQIVIDPWV